MRILLLGGGHTHALTLLDWIADPPAGARLSLVSRSRFTPYSGMLPGLVAGHYRAQDIHIDLARLATRAGADFIEDEILSLDTQSRRAGTRSATFDFDIASIDLGSVADRRHIGGESGEDLAPKPLAPFLQRLAARDAGNEPFSLAVVGGGPAGVELALALKARWRARLSAMSLIVDGPDILPSLPQRARRLARRALNAQAIAVVTQKTVAERRPGAIIYADGAILPVDEVVWTISARPALDLGKSALALDERGFVKVTPTLQALHHPHVFACGDMASFTPPIPKAGVYAVRQAPILSANIRALAAGRPLIPYRPQTDMLLLLATANGRAIGVRNGITLGGRLMWHLKDRIDRGFMARFA